MFVTGHKVSRCIAKIFLSAICCSLLIVQSSYRFYQFANARQARAVHGVMILPARNGGDNGPATGARAGLSFRSLDKRFEIEPFFLLPIPIISPAAMVHITTHNHVSFATVLIDRSDPTLFLRGPPEISC